MISAKGLFPFLIGLVVFGDSAWGIDTKGIELKLGDQAESIEDIKVTLVRHVSNQGRSGKLLQQFTDQEDLWISKKHQQFKRGRGREFHHWDVKRNIRERLIGGVKSREDFEGTLEDLLPPIMLYVLYPQSILDRMQVVGLASQESQIILDGRAPRAPPDDSDEVRWKLGIDLRRGVIVSVKTYLGDERLVEEIDFSGWYQHEEIWLPSQVVMRRHAATNILMIQYTWNEPVVNRLSPSDFNLR